VLQQQALATSEHTSTLQRCYNETEGKQQRENNRHANHYASAGVLSELTGLQMPTRRPFKGVRPSTTYSPVTATAMVQCDAQNRSHSPA
jgi:hypothetical protein